MDEIWNGVAKSNRAVSKGDMAIIDMEHKRKIESDTAIQTKRLRFQKKNRKGSPETKGTPTIAEETHGMIEISTCGRP